MILVTYNMCDTSAHIWYALQWNQPFRGFTRSLAYVDLNSEEALVVKYRAE